MRIKITGKYRIITGKCRILTVCCWKKLYTHSRKITGFGVIITGKSGLYPANTGYYPSEPVILRNYQISKKFCHFLNVKVGFNAMRPWPFACISKTEPVWHRQNWNFGKRGEWRALVTSQTTLIFFFRKNVHECTWPQNLMYMYIHVHMYMYMYTYILYHRMKMMV